MDQAKDRRRALALLGPLEGRLMDLIWSGTVKQPFVVREVLAHTPKLAYTTVMTTLNRLVDKNLLRLDKRAGSRAHRYRAAGDIADFLASAGGAEVDRLIKQYGDVALAAFADRLDSLTLATSEALRKLRQQK